MLTQQQLDDFRRDGHLTVPGLFSPKEIADAAADLNAWSAAFLRQLSGDQEQWFLEPGMAASRQLRKLDNPVFHRDLFRRMAATPRLVEAVEQMIGPGVSVFFSQVFLKPPEGGGPKPVHQDNFYFGPDDPHALLTAWIAIDDATIENGCLFYCNGSHQRGVLEHVAPPDEPFNLQVRADQARRFEMTPAPVTGGGVSFHHGNTLHQSSANTSRRPRCAVAVDYLRNDGRLVTPALEYDPLFRVRIT